MQPCIAFDRTSMFTFDNTSDGAYCFYRFMLRPVPFRCFGGVIHTWTIVSSSRRVRRPRKRTSSKLALNEPAGTAVEAATIGCGGPVNSVL